MFSPQFIVQDHRINHVNFNMQPTVLLRVQISLGCGPLAVVQYAPWYLEWPWFCFRAQLVDPDPLPPTEILRELITCLQLYVFCFFLSYGRNAYGI